MKKNNRGFTLIELIVVIAIVGIMAGLIGASVSTASVAKQRQTATGIDSYISMCRTRCLTRTGSPYIVLSRDVAGAIVGKYYENGIELETETFGGKNIPVSYNVGSDNSGSAKNLDGGATLKISFARGTGGLLAPNDNLWIHVGKYKIRVYALTGAHRFE